MTGKPRRLNSREVLAMNIHVGRTVYGWSQERYGLECGLKRTYIGALERGEINPGIDNLDKLAAGFGVASYVLLMSPAEAHPLIYQKFSSRG